MQQSQVVERFIGRDKELALFSEWLADPHAPWILYFYDAAEEKEKKGGVGKTWLLHKCAELAREQRPELAIVMVDFFNVTDRDGIAVAEHVVEGLRAIHPAWFPVAFIEAVKRYRETTEESEATAVQLKGEVEQALASDLQKLDKQLQHDETGVLLFFDTFELIEQHPSIAVLNETHLFPDSYSFAHMHVVIAGRNALDWQQQNWIGREREVLEVALAPFSEQEMVQYLVAESIYAIELGSEQAGALYRRTEGRPILLGLVADVLNHRVLTLDEIIAIPMVAFERYLVTQINCLDKPLNWVVLFMAHAYHRFNMIILEQILRDSQLKHLLHEVRYQELVEALPQLSFVRQPSSGGDFVLHDEMRRLVTRYCWEVQDPDGQYRKEISQSVIHYYEREIEQVQNEQIHQAYIVEMLYHQLIVDLDEGIRQVLQQARQATKFFQTSFAYLLLQEAQSYIESIVATRSIGKNEGEQMPVDIITAFQNELQLEEVRRLLKDDDASEALRMIRELEQRGNGQWLQANWEALLFEKGTAHQKLSQFPEAVECLTAALNVGRMRGNEEQEAKRIANIQGKLGYIQRRRGQLKEAIHHYEESANIYRMINDRRKYADVLNSIANVYRFQGKIEEALRYGRIGWRIRLDLFEEKQAAEVPVGISLSTLGMIYLEAGDASEAEKCFQEAFEIYKRTGHKKGIATIYNRFGQVQMLEGNLERAQEWLETSRVASIDVDTEIYINSLQKLGRIYTWQKKWLEAKSLFEQAIVHAAKTHDDYQQAECLIGFSEVLEHLGQRERSLQVWKEAKAIALKENHLYLLGWAENIRAELYYNAKEYEKAFEHHLECCQYMARHNNLKYIRAVRIMIAALLGLPKDKILPIVTFLIEHWSALPLSESHRELISGCEEVKELLL